MFKKHYFITLLLLFSIVHKGYSIEKNPVKKKLGNSPSERIYTSSLKEGFIGTFDNLPIDSPADNVFTVPIDKMPDADEQVFLTYELYGISNHTGISRSINDQLSVGGYLVTQSNDWQFQNEQLKTSWLKQGNNQIRFTLPKGAQYHYRIRNLGIVIKKAITKVRSIVLNQPVTAEYANGFGYANGFIEGKGSENAKLYIDGLEIKTLSSEFEALVPKTGTSETWKATVKAVFADGQTVEKQIEFKQKATLSYKNDLSIRSAEYSFGQYSPEKSMQLSVKGASITMEAQALSQPNTISITALRTVDIPALDGTMVNVTKNYDGFRFLPHGTQFTKNTKVALEYDADKIPDGYTAKDIKTFYFDENVKHWVALERDSIQNGENVIVSNTTHFTDMINGIIKVPESPETAGFVPTSISGIKAADPSAAVNTIEPPTANSMGSASLGYPIEIPAGRQGMQPQLAIQYNSNGGNDWLGLGWNMSIPSVNIDTRWGVPRYDGSLETETYSFSGEELTPVAHRGELMARSSDKQFYPRVEGSFNKIIRHGSNPKNYWWEVTDKSGTTHSFGGSSRGGIVNTAVLKDQDGNIAQWSLVETRDLNDNFVKYHYVTVQDFGIAGGTVPGYNNYIDKITYTGSGGSEGKYEVLFTRDRELGETKRNDVSINARLGFKQVTADLLRKIEVKYAGTTVRSYDLHYKEGAFFKNLLDKITEFDSKGQEFNHHEMEYFDDVKAAEGYKPYTDEVNIDPKDDNIKGNFLVRKGKFNDDASALGGTKSSGYSGGIAVTVGTGANIFSKDSSAGANFSFGQSKGEGMLTLIDINGDNLPDKVYVKDEAIKFRPYIRNANGDSFGDEITAIGRGNFSKSKSQTYSYGIESHFFVFAGLQKTDFKTTIQTYFCDVNGDGLVDIVDNTVVYFNRLVDGVPTFETASSRTPNPIGVTPAGVETSSAIDPAELEKAIDQYPLEDMVRVWEAPYTGIVDIDAAVALDPNEKSVDGVRAVIQYGSKEIWNTTIAANDFTAKSANLQSVNVKKGDRIYFRLQSVFNGEADVVLWNPIITYNQHTADKTDANNIPIYQFKASDGFVLSAMQAVETPINGTVVVDGLFQKLETTDDITVSIVKTGENKNTEIVWEKTYLATETISQEMNIPLTVNKGNSYVFKISSDSNIDWKALKWNPRLVYTASSDPEVPTVTNQDGTPMLEFFPTVDYGLYAKTVKQATSWKATTDCQLKATPRIVLNNAAWNGNLTFTIKKKNKLVSKQQISVVNGVVSGITPVHINALLDETYYFDLHTKDSLLAVALTTAAIDIAIKSVTTTQDIGIATIRKSDFGPMYHYWGQFGYNGNRGRATQPMDENLLKITSADAATIDISGATTEEEMETSFAAQGGKNVNEKIFIMLSPNVKEKAWVGLDKLNWLSETKQSSSRLGNQVLNDETGTVSDGVTVNGIVKKTKSYSVGLSVSGGVGGVSGGGSVARGESIIQNDFMDLNGDRYPDIIEKDKVRYTKSDGTLESDFRTTGTVSPQVSINHSGGLSVGGGPSTAGPVGSHNVFGKCLAQDVKTKNSLGINASFSENSDSSSHTFMDVNGDGLLDKVFDNGKVALNLGYSFAAAETWGFASIRSGSGKDFGAGLGFSYKDGSWSGGIGLSLSTNDADTALEDINGDGLPDYYSKKNNNVVYLNTGNGFTQVNWQGLNSMQEGLSVGESANAAFTFGFTFWGTFKICFNPSISANHSVSRETLKISDIDGDGNPDILSSNTDSELKAKISTIARTNKLKSVSRPLGASFELDYAKVGNTYEQPSAEWVLSEVKVKDGLAGDGADEMVNTFEYEKGHYDRHERDFYGYATVKSHQLDTQKGNAVYRTVVQEFNNDNFYEKGALKRQTLENADQAVFTESTTDYELKDIKTGQTLAESFKKNDKDAAFLASVKTQKNFYEGGNSAQKTTASTYKYDRWGNVTGFTDYGDAGNQDDISSMIAYHEYPDNYLMGTPKSAIVNASGKTVRKTETTIDRNTGAVTQIKKYLQNGKAATYDMKYDSYGNLVKMTRPENATGQRMFHNYDYDSEVHTYTTAVSDAFGYKSSATYDYAFGQLLENRDANGNQMRYTLDGVGRVATITGPLEMAAGVPFTIAFDYFQNAKVPYATTAHYDPAHPQNFIETVTFIDGLKRAVQVKKDADLFTAAKSADQENMIVSGKVIFDAFGRAAESYYPTQESKGSTATFSAALDFVAPTKTVYDVLDRATTITLPDGATSSMAYGFGNDREGAVQFSTKATDANGIWKESYTNVRGLTRATQEQYSQGSNVWTSFEYNALGEPVLVKDDQNNETLSSYDWLGRRTQVTHPDAGTTVLDYDLNGNVTQKLTANLKAAATPITYKYDFERLAEINYPLNPQNNVKYTYGAKTETNNNRVGRVTLQEDGSGAQEFFYNPLGAVTKNIRTIIVPDVTPLTYATEWTYDTWNRVSEMLYPDGEKLTYHYNLGGLLQEMYGEKNGEKYKYITQLGYDKFEQRQYLSYGNGTEMSYSYEPERRRLSTMETKTASHRVIMDNVYTYDKVNNILRLQNKAEIPASNLMGGPADYNYTYDDLYQLVTANGLHKGSNQENRYGLEMKYNSVHGIVKKDQTQDFKNAGGDWTPKKINTYTADYKYDPTGLPHAPVHIADKAYTYDLNGNQTGWTDDQSGQQREILWDEENRIKAMADNGAAFYYLYDAAGERTVKMNGGSLSVAINGSPKQGKGSMGNASIYVNHFIVLRNGQVTKHFYAGSQRIASKLTDNKDGLLQKMAGETKVKYTDKQAALQKSMAETSAVLGVEKIKIFDFAGNSNNVPPGLSGIHPDNGNNGNHNGNSDPTDTTSTIDPKLTEKFIFFYHPDHLGSSSYISDANGEVSQHLEYFAFGETFLEEHSNTSYTPYLFNGKELDDETGLYYYGARYQDPKNGVFLSVDPLAEQTMTPYAYCNNNPINMIDPTGMSTEGTGATPPDDYLIHKNGQIEVFKTNDNFDRFFTEVSSESKSGQISVQLFSQVAQLDKNESGLVKFPDSGDGFSSYGGVEKGGMSSGSKKGVPFSENVGAGDSFLKPKTAAALFGVVAELNESGISISFGDMSSSNGSDPANAGSGAFHHAGHGHMGKRSGLDVDFRYIGRNGNSYQGEMTNGKFSVGNNKSVYDAAFRFGFDPKNTYQGKTGSVPEIKTMGGHNNHGHLGFKRN